MPGSAEKRCQKKGKKVPGSVRAALVKAEKRCQKKVPGSVRAALGKKVPGKKVPGSVRAALVKAGQLNLLFC